MSNESPLTSAEEIELDRSLAEIQRYPLEISSEEWKTLQDLAKRGDRRGQLALLRSTTTSRPARPGGAFRSTGDSVPAIVQELLERLQAAEQRAAVAEERLRRLEEDA